MDISIAFDSAWADNPTGWTAIAADTAFRYASSGNAASNSKPFGHSFDRRQVFASMDIDSINAHGPGL
jgi:hypothetical protein